MGLQSQAEVPHNLVDQIQRRIWFLAGRRGPKSQKLQFRSFCSPLLPEYTQDGAHDSDTVPQSRPGPAWPYPPLVDHGCEAAEVLRVSGPIYRFQDAGYPG